MSVAPRKAFFKEGHDDLGWRHYVVGFVDAKNSRQLDLEDARYSLYSSERERLKNDDIQAKYGDGPCGSCRNGAC